MCSPYTPGRLYELFNNSKKSLRPNECFNLNPLTGPKYPLKPGELVGHIRRGATHSRGCLHFCEKAYGRCVQNKWAVYKIYSRVKCGMCEVLSDAILPPFRMVSTTIIILFTCTRTHAQHGPTQYASTQHVTRSLKWEVDARSNIILVSGTNGARFNAMFVTGTSNIPSNFGDVWTSTELGALCAQMSKFDLLELNQAEWRQILVKD